MKLKKSRIKHIVKQFIMRADLGADVEAIRLHRQAEKLIEDSGIPYTFLRPNEFMQGLSISKVLLLRVIMLFTYRQKI
jgi:uncharacterized protein YbjT (DUF2867 family)